jgi:hypothetical protein
LFLRYFLDICRCLLNVTRAFLQLALGLLRLALHLLAWTSNNFTDGYLDITRCLFDGALDLTAIHDVSLGDSAAYAIYEQCILSGMAKMRIAV